MLVGAARMWAGLGFWRVSHGATRDPASRAEYPVVNNNTYTT